MANVKRIGKGTPLTEEVTKGSMEYTIRAIRRAFYRQFGRDGDEFLMVEEIFADYVIVYSDGLAHDEFYRVYYARTEDSAYTFAPRDEWEVVELSYRTRTTVNESHQQRGGSRHAFDEIIVGRNTSLGEAADGQPRRVYGDVAFADTVNRNRRRYPEDVLVEAVRVAKQGLDESLKNGRAYLDLLGEEDHPGQKLQPPRLTETIVVWDDIWYEFETKEVKAAGRMIENSRGRDAIVTMEAGVYPKLSLRAVGESHLVKEGKSTVEEVLWLEFKGIDFVMAPGFADAGVTTFENFTGSKEKKRMSKMNGGKDGAGADDQTDHDTGVDLVALAESLQGLSAVEIRKLHPRLADELIELIEAERKENARRAQQVREQKLRELQEFANEQQAALRAELGIGPTDDLETALKERNQRLQELEEAEQRRSVAQYIEAEVGKLKYPDYLVEQFCAAVGQPGTIEEAKQAVINQRAIFDKIVAGTRLHLKGFTGGVDVLGSVLERETGVPEYARAAHFICEQVNQRTPYSDRVPGQRQGTPTLQEQVLGEYLEKFDARHQHKLQSEAEMFAEAMETADLTLPTSILRAVITQVYPTLISPVIFDWAIAAQNPIEIFFEKYVGETGETLTVSGEDVTIVLDSWVSLARARLIPGTVVVTNAGATETYEEDDDYVIDYEDGRIYVLSTGDMVAAAHKVSYSYRATREGEMAPIPRGKVQIVSDILRQKADRLAQQISSEALTFSKSQLGWDATYRTITALVSELTSKIDGDRLRAALNATKTVPNNSGGTWVAASDNLDKLATYIGNAKVKVANRQYAPSFIVVSTTVSDLLSNWEKFTAAGTRADSTLNANGYVGRVKGLPVFETTQFPDSHILVGHRELVIQRSFAPMTIKGPYHSTDGSGNLVAAEQHYIEEYNGSVTPVPEKGSFVRLK